MLGTSFLLAGLSLGAAPAIKASSEGKDSSGTAFPATNAFDGLLSTGWAEGDQGPGKGAWIELKFDHPTDVASVSLWPGRLEAGTRSLREYGRPSYVTIALTTASGAVTQQVRLLDPGEQGAYRQDVAISAPGATVLRVTIDDALAGGIYDLTFVAEIAVNFAGGSDDPRLAQLATWAATPPGQDALAKDRDEITALYNRITAAEFGDRDAFSQLMDRAGDGAPYLRAMVAKMVPAGFRAQALPPDDQAIDALIALKDANAIPAIDLAALRTRGPRADEYRQRVEMFTAYQAMVGGGRRNIAAWGETGWEKGALQGLGEPLPIAVDDYGEVFVADVGNSRIQRFDKNGASEQVWGLPPDITNLWFGGTRAWYASGSRPGEDPGAFVNPVSLALIPEHKGVGFVVLDGHGRVTRIDKDGNVVTVFKVEADGGISPGVGGEGHVVVVGGKIAVVWANQLLVYSMDGTQEGKYDLPDGSPTGAVPLGGKVALVYGPQLILYGLDGFRFGDQLHGTLGEGFEAWGAAIDEAGKLWAALDTGEVVKFKTPGKVDYRFKLTDWSLHEPRIAVYDDFVYVTSDDKIIRADALSHAAPEKPPKPEKAEKAPKESD